MKAQKHIPSQPSRDGHAQAVWEAGVECAQPRGTVLRWWHTRVLQGAQRDTSCPHPGAPDAGAPLPVFEVLCQGCSVH